MIYAKDLLDLFKKKSISFFTGVPDSVLKNFFRGNFKTQKEKSC